MRFALSPLRFARRTGSPRGMIYPILLVSILVIGVATAGAAQLWSTQVKREKEAELLFRLGEFRRAGLVRSEGRRLLIRDPDDLRRRCE